jgi:hypothetical protein
MAHSTTTFQRIVRMYERAGALLAQEAMDDAERVEFRQLQSDLDQYWERERASRVFAQHGPPRMISAPDPRSQRQIARGIAPLPSGGD